ncbi:MAG: Na+/H+ antiporter NhaA [Sandaracinus sp.]
MTSPDATQAEVPQHPPEAWPSGLRFARLAARPLERFLRIEAASGIVLLVVAAIAFGWAISPWHASYEALLATPMRANVGPFSVERSLHWLIDDGLMTIFFFVVGLEIRREIDHGELSDRRRATLPVVAALGGMIVPALVYTLLAGHQAPNGWGVPMATDIAFALGVLALLGPRVPPALRVLLLALAVIDDLGAILVIALFYSGPIDGRGLGVALLGAAAILVFQRFGIRRKLAYVPPAMVVWLGVLVSGIHPTIAGVVVGLMTPVRAWLGPGGLVQHAPRLLEELGRREAETSNPHALAETLATIDHLRREAISPAESLIESLHPWVAFAIMPVFAFANAGVAIQPSLLGREEATVAVGVAVGLIVGKLVGVLGASHVAIRSGLAACPRGITTRHLVVLGTVAGIGFTMALFVAGLGFQDAENLAAAKLGVLVGSTVAGLCAWLLGRWLLPVSQGVGAASADEAEGSTEL